MSVPYFHMVEFEVEPCQITWVELPFSQRGIINSISISPAEDIRGEDQNAAFAIYCKDFSEESASLGSNPSCSLEGFTEFFRDIGHMAYPYMVVPLTETDGGGLFQVFESDYAYCNAEGTPTNPVKRLYLAFASLTDNTRNWRISYTYTSPNLY